MHAESKAFGSAAIYLCFVRSGMEYGSVLYMGAAESHLQKLDRIQSSAQALGDFSIESLESRSAGTLHV